MLTGHGTIPIPISSTDSIGYRGIPSTSIQLLQLPLPSGFIAGGVLLWGNLPINGNLAGMSSTDDLISRLLYFELFLTFFFFNGSFKKEMLCTVLTGLCGMPGGVLQFIPFYHPLHDMGGVHTENCVALLALTFLMFAWSADRNPIKGSRSSPGNCSSKASKIFLKTDSLTSFLRGRAERL